VANVSHELRTPLTVINGFLETMADMPDLPREQAQQFIGLMQKEGARMQTLLADLLTLSRLESGLPAEQTPIDLSSLAESLSGDGDTLSAGKHEIHTDIAPDIWISGIYADLYNGLSNLVFKRRALHAGRRHHPHQPASAALRAAFQPARCALCRARQRPGHRAGAHPASDRAFLSSG
jgi:light-regulated signal transduction histidine kinase (bacteriophytochrome)